MRSHGSASWAGAFCADGQATVGDEDSCIILPEWTIRCGPRKTIYHDPKQVRAGALRSFPHGGGGASLSSACCLGTPLCGAPQEHRVDLGWAVEGRWVQRHWRTVSESISGCEGRAAAGHSLPPSSRCSAR